VNPDQKHGFVKKYLLVESRQYRYKEIGESTENLCHIGIKCTVKGKSSMIESVDNLFWMKKSRYCEGEINRDYIQDQ